MWCLPIVKSICYYEPQDTCKTGWVHYIHLQWWLFKYYAWKWKMEFANLAAFPHLLWMYAYPAMMGFSGHLGVFWKLQPALRDDASSLPTVLSSLFTFLLMCKVSWFSIRSMGSINVYWTKWANPTYTKATFWVLDPWYMGLTCTSSESLRSQPWTKGTREHSALCSSRFVKF